LCEASDRLLQRIVEWRARRKNPRWPGDREDHWDLRGDQPRHIIEESGLQRRLRRAEHGQADARPLGIMGGQIVRLKIHQHTGFVGAPILREPGEIAPAAMIGPADGEAGLMDGAALGAEMGAGLSRHFLEFGRIHVQDDAARRAFPARPARDQIHKTPPFGQK